MLREEELYSGKGEGCLLEIGQVLGAGNEFGAHAFHVRIGDLAVYELYAGGLEVFDQLDEGVLAGVGDD